MTESDPDRPEAGPIQHPSRAPPVPPSPLTRFHQVAILVIVEGQHDIHFLRRISRTLHQQDATLPDLAAWESSGRLIFVPTAGGDLMSWTTRFAGFGVPEFHLYDREAPPETATRERVTELVNRRPGCRAVLTGKRGTENYLHGAAIHQARGIELSFGDFDDVPDLAAQHCYALRHESAPWSDLPFRTRKRLRDRAKRWLNTWAVERMTPELLAERDPAGEVRSWLEAIVNSANQPHRDTL